ncbi:MAG: hypothetical protein Q3979_05605 [Actinomycetaceae bacterium]|nr:hypothetical protein [Actinomycetaceae bacterium]
MAATTKKNPPAKGPSAAELARREAQSAKDRGENIIDVTVRGLHVRIHADDLDDWDAMSALDDGNPKPMLELIFPDDQARAAELDKLRDENGKLRASTIAEWIVEFFTEVGAGN